MFPKLSNKVRLTKSEVKNKPCSCRTMLHNISIMPSFNKKFREVANLNKHLLICIFDLAEWLLRFPNSNLVVKHELVNYTLASLFPI